MVGLVWFIQLRLAHQVTAHVPVITVTEQAETFLANTFYNKEVF